MADLRGRVAVVTGASRGVGKGVAEGLAEAGATVYVTGRSESDAEPPAERTIQATAAAIADLGGEGIAVRVDHNEDAEVAALFARVAQEQGRLTLILRNPDDITIVENARDTTTGDIMGNEGRERIQRRQPTPQQPTLPQRVQ